MAIMTTTNNVGSDPWLFAFNVDTLTGASNDDSSGTTNSRIDRSDFSFINSGSNVVVLAGYFTGGDAVFHGFTR